MSTDYLFGVFQAKQRMVAADERKRGNSGRFLSTPPATGTSAAREKDRQEAYLRVFDAIRASVQDTWYLR